MIRVTYNNGFEEEYDSVDEAKFMITTVLFASAGNMVPVEAVEVIALPDQDVTVERVLNIKLGVVELD